MLSTTPSRLIFAMVACAPLLGFATPSAAREARVALVISEAAYQAVSPLSNPSRDGALIAKALSNAGFSSIVLKADLTKSELDRALRDFKREADGAEIALVYYAGHGVEIEGKNWLLPIDAELRDAADVVAEGVPLENILHFLQGASKLRIVVLDACRDNPFVLRLETRGLKRGLSPVEGLERGTIVAYSASFGQKAFDGPPAGNSPFAASLANRIIEAGLEVRFLFAHVRDDVLAANPKQEPWIGTSLSAEEIYLVPPTSNLASETSAFASAAKRWTPDAWNDFLRAYPDGELRLAAQQALASLSQDRGRPQYAARSLRSLAEDAKAALDSLAPQELASMEPILLVTRVVSASSKDGLLQLAESGDVRAQRLAARALRTGLSGFPVDPRRAVALLTKAATLNDPGAQAALGFMYDTGEGGLRRDQREASRLYSLAAAAGDPLGQANLGAMYEQGLGGLAKDEDEALRLYSLSAAQGSALGQANLGVMYQSGRGGLQKDEKQAEKLLRLAAAQGNPTGQANLGVFIEEGRAGLAKNADEATRLYKLSAEQGNSAGQANLAYAYENGLGGLPKDLKEALRLYQLAAEQDMAWAKDQVTRLRKTSLD